MEMGAEHQSLVAGQWHLEEVILQALFHASRWEHEVREAHNATQVLHQTQVRVVELLDEFSRGLVVLDLHSLYLVAVQATLKVYTQHLEALLADLPFHAQYPPCLSSPLSLQSPPHVNMF